ncbi:MAG: hypothetical protein OER93_07800, partial [Thermoleophilia bacterium]|nr:hypothetical protein [Thermoleophilia bacterium]
YADDPTDPTGARADVISPVSSGTTTWSEYVDEHPELADYAAEHWLGAHRRLQPVPANFAAERADFHRVGFHVLSTVREQANGKIALRYTHRGFGTPFYGNDEQLRVEGTQLVHQQAGSVRSEPITTLNAAASFAGIAYDPGKAERFDSPPPVDGDQPLEVSEQTAAGLGDWFGFAYSVLEELRLNGGPEHDVGRVQLWAEHFDPAVELGSADAGQRASYGASPGDDAHPEPYLYVGAWGEIDRANPFWNDEAFNGGAMSYDELLAADDQPQAALDYFRTGFAILTGG